MIVERNGQPVRVVPGDERNVKITTPEDLAAARARLTPVPRVGTGYDLHRLVAGRPLVLAGVVVPFERGPLGHSDGDVVCHALIDAMLGAAACGDIGQHFPDTDPRWKDAAGLDLLAAARQIVGDKGFLVSSADVTVILERPKLAPHLDAIRRGLAQTLGLPVDQVSVKGKDERRSGRHGPRRSDRRARRGRAGGRNGVMTAPRVRFAPSPTGHLHVGNARTALFNWLLARGHDGVFILRIEDTDAERSSTESEQAILEDLRWLGLDWDEGPDLGGPHPPYRQSERLELYRSYARDLIARDRAYYCFCPPDELEAERKAALKAGLPPKYGGRCRAIPPEDAARRVADGERGGVRFAVPAGQEVGFDDLVRGEVTFHTDVIGDPVIVRSDGRPAYNFAVVIDDALMEVTHVIRGEDHISNTPRQILHVRGPGFHAAAVRPSVARAGTGSRAVVEAARRHQRGGVPRTGIPARVAGQLPCAARLVAW